MIDGITAWPTCGLAPVRKKGRHRRGPQIYQGKRCDRRFTKLSGTHVSGHHFPPEVIGLAVRWYLRYRLTLAAVPNSWSSAASMPIHPRRVHLCLTTLLCRVPKRLGFKQ